MNIGKRYLCIGAHIVSQSDGETHYVAAIHLPRLYKIHPDASEFARPEDIEMITRTKRFDKLIWLWPKQNGDYIIPSHSTCKCGETMLWMTTKEGKKICVNVRPEIVGMKTFDPATMISHFATCPMAADFKKNKVKKHP